nr:hypothetical protein [uncultured Desulfuromonas sp.]
MHKIYANPEKNYLYVILSGIIDADDAQAIRDEILAALDELEDGFHLISDMSEAVCGYVSCLPLFQESITAIATHHVGRVIRIVSDSVFHSQIIAVSQQFARYTVEQASSLEEAEAMLAQNVTAADPS